MLRSDPRACDDDGSRPDLELSDRSGVPVILFENKFWAGLTEAQPNTYLERLRDVGGLLWFVAPAERLPLLWPTLLRTRAASAGHCPEEFLDSAEVKVARVSERVSLALSSWGYLLGQIERALEGEGDLDLAGGRPPDRGPVRADGDCRIPSAHAVGPDGADRSAGGSVLRDGRWRHRAASSGAVRGHEGADHASRSRMGTATTCASTDTGAT